MDYSSNSNEENFDKDPIFKKNNKYFTICWPAKPPDLTPFDILAEYLKKPVFCTHFEEICCLVLVICLNIYNIFLILCAYILFYCEI